MKRFIGAVILSLAALAAAPSQGADLRMPFKAPAAPYFVGGFSWTGFYAGINGGYGFGKSNYDFGAGVTTGDFDVKGGLLGGTLGYNLQTGSWVWGLEGDFDASWIKGTETAVCVAPGCTTRNLWLGTGRGRLGFAFDRTMIYATGGAAFGALKFSPGPNPEQTKTKVGWTAGAGAEYAFAGPWSVKAEYLYVDLGKTDCDVSSCGGAVTSTVKFKANIVRAGVNYRF